MVYRVKYVEHGYSYLDTTVLQLVSAMGWPPGVSSVRSCSEQLAGVGDACSAREIGEGVMKRKM